MTKTVKQLMTPDPITIDPDAPVATAVAVMRERSVRHLPVIDERRHLVGILTDGDVRNALLAPAFTEYLSAAAARRLRGAGEALEKLRVRDVMTWDAMSIGPEAPVAQAAALMVGARIGGLPVLQNGTLVGIITKTDALKALAATLPSVRGLDPDTYLW